MENQPARHHQHDTEPICAGSACVPFEDVFGVTSAHLRNVAVMSVAPSLCRTASQYRPVVSHEGCDSGSRMEGSQNPFDTRFQATRVQYRGQTLNLK